MRIESKEWPELSQLLDRMLDLPTEERAVWVERLAGPDALWAPRLLELLRGAHTSARAEWLDTLPKFDEFTDPYHKPLPLEDLPCEPPGAEIGPYRLVRLLGRGGMGDVWYAERSDGLVRRGIALKLPRGLNADEVLAGRFAREREILAGLVHPHIARLYDAGVVLIDQGIRDAKSRMPCGLNRRPNHPVALAHLRASVDVRHNLLIIFVSHVPR
jgi:eukaryotic-like serine/threonine-protein kinase